MPAAPLAASPASQARGGRALTATSAHCRDDPARLASCHHAARTCQRLASPERRRAARSGSWRRTWGPYGPLLPLASDLRRAPPPRRRAGAGREGAASASSGAPLGRSLRQTPRGATWLPRKKTTRSQLRLNTDFPPLVGKVPPVGCPRGVSLKCRRCSAADRACLGYSAQPRSGTRAAGRECPTSDSVAAHSGAPGAVGSYEAFARNTKRRWKSSATCDARSSSDCGEAILRPSRSA